MKLFTKIRYTICEVLESWKKSRKIRKYMSLYPDFKEENEYDCGDYKFIWGVKSPCGLCESPACLHTMNDIDIVYSRESKRYVLNIETAYWFNEREEDVIAYLQSLLNNFTKFMDSQKYNKNCPYRFWMSQPSRIFEAETIPELYTNFKMFVEGYKAVHIHAIANITL